jgi:hypothetical protein
MEVLLMTTRIGVIGSGVVGQVLAAGFAKHGFETMIGSRTPENLAEWAAGTSPSVATGTVEETANHADLVVLAVKGTAAGEAARLAGHALAGKTVIDATNPIADAPPEGGVLKFFTSLDESLMEKLQAATPEARFVKAFSCVGNALMINPDLHLRLGDRGHGRRRNGPRHRASLHPVVHPRLPEQPVDACLQAVEAVSALLPSPCPSPCPAGRVGRTLNYLSPEPIFFSAPTKPQPAKAGAGKPRILASSALG